MKLFSLLVVCLIAVFLPQKSAFGQCPPNTAGCTWAATVSPDFLYKDCYVRVQYCYRTCNGVCEIAMNR